MTRAALVGLACVVAIASIALVPDRVSADPRHRFKGHSHRDRLHSVPPQRFFPRRFHHHGHRGRSVPFIVGPSVIIYAPPAPVYAPPVYAPEPVYYPPPVYVPPVSSALPPTERVIEFPNGRYELQGDGVTTPYRWVWIPNPPTAPPSEAAPDVTPKAAPAPPEPAHRTELYRWTDDDGAVHWTDRWDKVPEAYRSRVTKTQS